MVQATHFRITKTNGLGYKFHNKTKTPQATNFRITDNDTDCQMALRPQRKFALNQL